MSLDAIDTAYQHVAGVDAPLPYGPGGTRPADSHLQKNVALHVNGDAIPHVSDTPYRGVPTTMPATAKPDPIAESVGPVPYADRPTCVGARKDSKPCGAKSRDGGTCCQAHIDQE